MKRFSLLIVTVLFMKIILYSQLPFAGISQLPLAHHPSFAGSKNIPRIVLATNMVNRPMYESRARYVAFDNFLPKKRVGVGFYFMHDHQRKRMNYDRLDNFKEIYAQTNLYSSFPNKETNNIIGLSLSPKYNLNSKSSSLKYSFSPSIEVNYQHITESGFGDFIETFGKRERKDSIYITIDSLFYGNSTSSVNKLGVKIGGKFSSKKIKLLYLFSIFRSFSAENYSLFEGSIVSHQFIKRNFFLKNKLWQMNHRISSAYKLGNNNSSFGVVFFAGLEFRNYINSEFYINENDQFSSLYLQKRQKLPLLSSAFASALIRCNRLLFGGAYTKFDEYETFGVKVGTQFNSFRLVSIIYPSENLTRLQTAELALNIYLR